MPTTTIRFTFSTRSEAWAAMRAFDVAGIAAGYPTGAGECTLVVSAPDVACAADVGAVAGAYGYARVAS